MSTPHQIYYHYANLFVGKMQGIVEMMQEHPEVSPIIFQIATVRAFEELVEQCPDYFPSFKNKKKINETSIVPRTLSS